ncbi:hypothetical protein CI610_03404 [invertebrate metagenome]|uniref:Uncharacterized protein n=1 Tax=invertebrate metagenome TaxID=1711999 RepID=A0A2H9T3A2_9ZZZZ
MLEETILEDLLAARKISRSIKVRTRLFTGGEVLEPRDIKTLTGRQWLNDKVFRSSYHTVIAHAIPLTNRIPVMVYNKGYPNLTYAFFLHRQSYDVYGYYNLTYYL